MKKKIIIVVSVISVFALTLGGMFLIDKNRMDNNKPVVFSTWGYQYVPPVNIEKENIIVTDPDVETSQNITIPVKEKEDLIITLLDGWKYEVSGESSGEYHYAIKFYKSDENQKMMLYSYANFFGVCGTGLEMKELNLEDGNTANVGFYDGNEAWSFITFNISEDEIVAQNEGLTAEESNEALQMFKTLKLIKTLPGNIAVDERSFIAKIIEEEPSYLIVEPNDGEIEKLQSKTRKILIRDSKIGEFRDYLYGVGRKVIITYNPIIQSDTNVISGADIDVDGYDDFEITVVKSANAEKRKVLNNREVDKLNSDYDLYYYGLDEVNVKVNNKEMTFENALHEGYITLSGVLVKANRDEVERDSYDDGGSTRFHYEDYTIIKCNTLDGDRDLYICPKGTSINEVI